jgi:Arc/MetJ-type ribon-helix-helix transcriptional regulator
MTKGESENTEKITINLGLVDLGQIDLLVQEGFYTNRTDFIRTAIRTQLAARGEALDQTAVRRTLTLAFLHFKPAKAGGYFLSVIMSLVCLAALVNLTGLTRLIRDEILVTRQTVPTPTMTIAPSDTPTDLPTPTLTNTALPTDTLQPTSTLLPTPAYAIIAASVGGGARVRSDPGSGTALAVLINGTLVQVLPEIQSVDGVSWVHIRWNNLDGWILTSVLMATTETPLPPTLTLTPTP